MDEYIGVIKQFASQRCLSNYMFCEGQTLQAQQYQALFAVIGYTYGGNGTASFNLPDLRPNPPSVLNNGWGNKPKYIICVNGIFPDFD